MKLAGCFKQVDHAADRVSVVVGLVVVVVVVCDTVVVDTAFVVDGAARLLTTVTHFTGKLAEHCMIC